MPTVTIFESYPRPATIAGMPETGSPSVFARIKQVFVSWGEKAAQSRAEARLWDLAQSDERVMSELMLARKREDADDRWVLQTTAAEVETELQPAFRAANKPSALLGQGWAGVIEDAYQNRSRNSRLQAA